jgi:hypothetical protein
MKRDLHGSVADYDSVVYTQSLADSVGHRQSKADIVAEMVRDSAKYAVLTNARVSRVERTVAGDWVLQVYTIRWPDGKTGKHIEVSQIRHGKVVREFFVNSSYK